MNKKLFVPLAIIIIGISVAGVIAYTNFSKSSDQVSKSSDQVEEEIISSEEAGEKVISFINNNVLQDQDPASLIGTFEKDGLYEVRFDVQGEMVNWYITKNGSSIFPQVIDLKGFESMPKLTEEISE